VDRAEIWARCKALDERLRMRLPAWQPFPGWFEMRGVGRAVGGVAGAEVPPAPILRRVLEALLDAAAAVMDFEAQSEITALLAELEGDGGGSA
jgi:hypothetical protein